MELIDRQQAIDAMNGLPKYFDKTGTLCLDYADVLAVLTEHLPPAQPDLPIKEKCAYCPHCENCDVNDDLSITQSEQTDKQREFVELVVEYPRSPTGRPDHKFKPYYSIKYIENGEVYEGYGTYKPKVLSEYLKNYFLSSAQLDMLTI